MAKPETSKTHSATRKQSGFFARHRTLLFVLLFALLLRIGYLSTGIIPFVFDHGKDSVAVLHMIQTGSPKLIGPWTSIPGLFFGPGWYYLLAPALLIGQGNPLAPAYAMTVLVLFQVFLAYRYFGKYEALIIATTPLWMMFSRSAWNPFPMTLVTLVMFILIRKLQKQPAKPRYPTWLLVGLLTFAASSGFHFSTAFAVFYLLILPIWFFKNGLYKKVGNWLAAFGGFILPFVPQLLFEMRHNFVQTRAILNYFSAPSERGDPLSKISEVLSVTYGEVRLGFVPDIPSIVPTLWVQLIGVVAGGLLASALYFAWRSKRSLPLAFEMVVYAVIPLVGLIFLHFNLWYVWALAPIPVMIIGHMLRQSPKWVGGGFISLLVFFSVFRLCFFLAVEQKEMSRANAFLPIKLEAIQWVRDRSQNEPFASYQYEGDIYDYPYQYIYWWQAFYQGKPLPAEFSYQPGEWNYTLEKPELLAEYQKMFGVSDQRPKRVFYIVEKAGNPDFLRSWWDAQKHGGFVEIATLSGELTVYQAEVVE